MHSAPPLLVMDYVGPALGAVVFVLVMSLVKEPTRRTFNAIFVAGASGVYLSGGFGPWELLYPAIVTPVVYLGLRSVPVHRARVAHALLLGHRAPPLGQPDLALHAHVVVRMHDLRRSHRRLVSRRCTFDICVRIPHASKAIRNIGPVADILKPHREGRPMRLSGGRTSSS